MECRHERAHIAMARSLEYIGGANPSTADYEPIDMLSPYGKLVSYALIHLDPGHAVPPKASNDEDLKAPRLILLHANPSG